MVEGVAGMSQNGSENVNDWLPDVLEAARDRGLVPFYDRDASSCSVSFGVDRHLPVIVKDFHTMDEFVKMLPDRVDTWEADLRVYRDMVGVSSGSSGIRDSVRFWNDFYDNLEQLHGFVDDVNVLKKVFDNGFYPDKVKEGEIRLCDSAVYGAYLDVPAEHFADFLKDYDSALQNADFHQLAHKMADEDFYPGYSEAYSSVSNTVSMYETQLVGTENRLNQLAEGLRQVRPFEIPEHGLSENVARLVESSYKSLEEDNENSVEVDLSEVGKKKENSKDFNRDVSF